MIVKVPRLGRVRAWLLRLDRDREAVRTNYWHMSIIPVGATVDGNSSLFPLDTSLLLLKLALSRLSCAVVANGSVAKEGGGEEREEEGKEED